MANGLNGNGNLRLSLAWVFRSITGALIMVLLWVAMDAMQALERIETRLREVEVAVPSKYITREEVMALMHAMDQRITRRLDREFGPANNGR